MRKRWWAVALGLVGCAVAGTPVWFLVAGEDALSGPASPDEAVEGFFTSVAANDLFAAETFVSRSERTELDPLLTTIQGVARDQGYVPQGDSFRVQLDFDLSPSRKLATDAAAISADVTLTFDGLDGPLEVVADDLGDVVVEDLPIVVVRETDGWYVSPLLTAAAFVTDRLRLPAGDYEAVSADDSQGFSSAALAIEHFSDAIDRADALAAAEALAPGDARVVRVYANAIEELLDRSGDVDISAINVETVNDASVEVRSFELGLSGGDNVRFDDGCFETESDTVCPFEGIPLTEPLDLGGIPLSMAVTPDGAKVDLSGSVWVLAGRMLPLISSALLTDGLNLEVDAVQGSWVLGQPIELVFDPATPFRTFDAELTAGTTYALTGAGDGARLEVRTNEDEGWPLAAALTASDPVSEALFTPVSDGARIVTRAPVVCPERSLWGCIPGSGNATFSVTPLQVVTMAPDSIARPNLGPNGAIILSFESAGDGRYAIGADSPDVTIEQLVDDEVQPLSKDASGVSTLEPGTVRLLVSNSSAKAVQTAVAVVSKPLPQRGFDNGRRTVTVSLEGGGARVRLYARDGDEFEVVATPSGSQDIVLSGNCRTECRVDSGYFGGSERLDLIADVEPFYIEVRGYSSDDAYGTVTISVTFFD